MLFHQIYKQHPQQGQTNSSTENLEVFLSLLFSTVGLYMIVSYNTMIVFYVNCRLDANCNDDIRRDEST